MQHFRISILDRWWFSQGVDNISSKQMQESRPFPQVEGAHGVGSRADGAVKRDGFFHEAAGGFGAGGWAASSFVKREVVRGTLPPIIMEVENGALQDVWKVSKGSIFHWTMIVGKRVALLNACSFLTFFCFWCFLETKIDIFRTPRWRIGHFCKHGFPTKICSTSGNFWVSSRVLGSSRWLLEQIQCWIHRSSCHQPATTDHANSFIYCFSNQWEPTKNTQNSPSKKAPPTQHFHRNLWDTFHSVIPQKTRKPFRTSVWNWEAKL